MDHLARSPACPEQLSVWWRYTLTSIWVPQMRNQWWSRILSPQMKMDSNLTSSLQFFFCGTSSIWSLQGQGHFSGSPNYLHSVRSGPIPEVRPYQYEIFNRGSGGLFLSPKHNVCEVNAVTGRLTYWSRVILKLPWVIILYQSTKIPSPQRLSGNTP